MWPSLIFTTILNTRLEKIFINRNLIDRNKRTSDHMFVLTSRIDKYAQSNSKTLYTCFIDFRKAFDKVWHLGLLYRLKINEISDRFYNVIKDMYLSTQVSVKVNETKLAELFRPSVGVRQGDNLSPNLFKSFVNDFPVIFTQVELNSINLNCFNVC